MKGRLNKMNNNEYYQALEKKFEQMLNEKVAELERNYEATLRRELAAVALKFDSLKLILRIIRQIDIENKPTSMIYKIYKDICINLEMPYMSSVEFSRFIVKWFDYEIVDKKINGVKYRIFVKISDSVQDECKSSRLVQDAVQDEKQ